MLYTDKVLLNQIIIAFVYLIMLITLLLYLETKDSIRYDIREDSVRTFVFTRVFIREKDNHHIQHERKSTVLTTNTIILHDSLYYSALY